MNAVLINIGDELLIGQVVNTNASWMAAELEQHDVHVQRIITIADDLADIERTLCETEKADVVLITGGLGPTKDDITKEALCRHFGANLVVDQPSYDNVRDYFAKRGLPFSEVNKQQGMVPDCCEALLNRVGTAPGMWFERDGHVVVSLPGVPHEMRWLMTTYVLPRLSQRMGREAILHKTILTCGLGESFLAERIAAWEEALPENFRLAYLPDAGKVRLRLSAHGANHADLQAQMDAEVVKLVAIIPEFVYGYDDETLASVVGKMLLQHGATLATAESCTGGTLAHRITEVAGASQYYKGGVVSYSNELKMNLLGVRESTLEQFGAVSEQTACEMAAGCRQRLAADYAVATTGIAGPTGGSDEKPLGTVWIAVATPNGVAAQRYVFATTRAQHQERTTNQALFDLFTRIKSEE